MLLPVSVLASTAVALLPAQELACPPPETEVEVDEATEDVAEEVDEAAADELDVLEAVEEATEEELADDVALPVGSEHHADVLVL